jgi:hypothetical protein
MARLQQILARPAARVSSRAPDTGKRKAGERGRFTRRQVEQVAGEITRMLGRRPVAQRAAWSADRRTSRWGAAGCSTGNVTMNTTSSTSITSISGVMLMSAARAILSLPPAASSFMLVLRREPAAGRPAFRPRVRRMQPPGARCP